MRDKVTFEPNIPVQVTLQYKEGKIVEGRFGDQVMYSLQGNRIMFLDLAVSQQVNMLEPEVGESFIICKRPGQKGVVRGKWDVWLSPETEKFRAMKEHPGGDWGSPYPGKPVPQPAAPSELERQLQASLDQVNRRRNGEDLIQRRPPAAETAPIAAQGTGTNGPVAVPAPAAPEGAPRWANVLVAKADALIDAYAACLDHADRHGNRVKPDDVRALLTTVYIAMTKNGVSNAA